MQVYEKFAPSKLGARTKFQGLKCETEASEVLVLTCKAERWVVDVVPGAVEPIPAKSELAAALAEKRHAQVAIVVPNDRFPEERHFPIEVFTEDRDALRLNRERVGETKATVERVIAFQMLVELLATNQFTILLVVVEP